MRRLLFSLATMALIAIPMAGCGEQAPPAPPTEKDQVWAKVGEWSGHGNGQLETFPIERLTWRVRWETKNESPPGTGTFHVTANSGDSGRIVGEVPEFRGVGKDVEYITDIPRRYYFVVTSKNVDWTLIAEERVEQ